MKTTQTANSSAKFYKLGKLHFCIVGNGKPIEYLWEEFESLEEISVGNTDVRFQFLKILPPFPRDVNASPLWVDLDRTKFEVSLGTLQYQISGIAASEIEVLIQMPPVGRKERFLPDSWARAMNWNYLLGTEERMKDFVYNLFDYVTQCAQLSLGQTYVHASSIARGGRAVLFIAQGGVGKSASMLKFVLEDGWKYLSDDLAVINSAGIVWRSPKRMQIYAYNVENQDVLAKTLMRKRSLIDRCSWRWHVWRHGKKGARRRVSAEELFGKEGVTASAEVTKVFFLERTSVGGFHSSPLSHEDIVKRATSILLTEINPFFQVSTALHAVNGANVLPQIDELYSKSYEVLLRALSRSVVRLVVVPLAATPDQVFAYLQSLL